MKNLKKIDVFIVRFLPILLFIYLIKIVIDCWSGVSQYPFNMLHSNSFIYAAALFFVSLSDSRYHCIWNRAMYIELMFIPLMNYIDAKYLLFEDVFLVLKIYVFSLILTLIATIILAVRHIIKTRKRKRQTNGSN